MTEYKLNNERNMRTSDDATMSKKMKKIFLKAVVFGN